MTVHFTRRGLLGALGATVGLGALGALPVRARLAAAAEATDRYYVFAYFQGAWDVLLSLDPRDPGEFRDDRKKDTRIETGYNLLPTGFDDLVQTPSGLVFGPYIGELAEVASRVAVVRGLSMDTLTHEVGRRRFLTGRPPSGLQARGSSMATVLAAHLGGDHPLPNLACQVETYNDGLPRTATAVRVSTVDDLVRALKPASDVVSADERRQLQAMLEHFRECPDAAGSEHLQASFSFQETTRDIVSRGLYSLFDFTADRPEMRAIRDLYGIPNGDMSSNEAQAAMAVTAITEGISRVVSVRMTPNLDTHGEEWATDQGPRQMRGFNAVARMVRDLESRPYKDTGETWLDRTTIVLFSEFSRTPLLNGRLGRDHHLGNACALIGGGVVGGRAIGASSDLGMAPQPIDFRTGQVDAGGVIAKPENVLRGLLVHAGITEDVADLRCDPLSALFTAST